MRCSKISSITLEQFSIKFREMINTGKSPVIRIIVRDTNLSTKLMRNQFVANCIHEVSNSNIEAILVHYYEMYHEVLDVPQDTYLPYQIFASRFEEIIDHLWQLKNTTSKYKGSHLFLVFKDLEDIFRIIDNKLDRIENILKFLIHLRLPILLISFQSDYKLVNNVPYDSIYRNFGIYDLTIYPSKSRN